VLPSEKWVARKDNTEHRSTISGGNVQAAAVVAAAVELVVAAAVAAEAAQATMTTTMTTTITVSYEFLR
jgi:acetylornithine/succinyldiaminopimelate/putrescine aminotransferase